ncbi:MAG: BREX system P-loop protein BrxC [Desulfobacteraceae bacterium]|nr:BREX system P-loop protein BrxC [Desulfobacteraceae bacterium]MBL7173457.1 BREX system P-loop protein BrxC [Desulfobacteraceae bacterium]
MQIKSLFKKDIFRSINGVVKAHQLDDRSVWQELDEFVITRELDKHLRKFLSAYLNVMDNPHDPAITGKMGVWISGFFGSGKSHFLKVLSYLLNNRPHSYEGNKKRAVEFFDGKVKDAMLLGDIKRAVASDTDVILFNIDSKVDSKAGRDAVLAVFLKVLNEKQGYDGDHAHIAHMERYLDNQAKLEEFHQAYRDITGTEWMDERDVYEFNRDQVIEAFVRTLGQSRESAEKWIDNAENNFSLTVENFASWVKEYLDARGPNHRLVFLVDEIGQFIGTDGHLMLNLQTVAEDLGTLCEGRAWVIVTSQEEIDKVIGELRTATRNDFSKIQGRFQTRLSLSSANADEVILKRLLEKDEGVLESLKTLFQEKGDILRHQLSFRDCGMTLKSYADADDFAGNYPFAPYQFRLLQKIFEVIRRVGATGLHLAKGERSLLDAFQSAGQSVALKDVGVLVPLYQFYPSIESFLDTTVKRTIEQAGDDPSLEPFDIKLLQVLFLIRYVDEIKGNVDNLVTLCIDEIDVDRLMLRRKIEESLQRLEKQTLISRSGDNYFFLTNEERDVSREIKAVELSSPEEAALLGELIFEDVLRGQRKHRYAKNKMDFSFARICDIHPVGGRVEGGPIVSVISPMADEYAMYNDPKCVLESSNEGGQIIIRLRDDGKLDRELRTYAQTDKYLKNKSDTGLPESTKRILRDNAEDNRGRREILTGLLGDNLTEASYFVAGRQLTIKASAPAACLDEALEYLISNTFSKMGYLKHLHPEPLKEIQAVLRSNDVSQQTLALNLEESNPEAIQDLRNYIDLCDMKHHAIVLYEMIDKRYGVRPYGWPDMEVILLAARLLTVGEISLRMEGDTLTPDKVYENIKTPAKWRKITIHKRKTPDPKALQNARQLGKDVFAEMGPDNTDALCAFLKEKLRSWETSLNSFKPLADTGDYPGREKIAEALGVIRPLLASDESYKFVDRFNQFKNDLLDLSEEFHNLDQFYQNQRPTWEKLRSAYQKFQLNRLELDQDEQAAPSLRRMGEILDASVPYAMLYEAEELIRTVGEVNKGLIEGCREKVTAKISALMEEIKKELEAVSADGNLRTQCLKPLERLLEQARNQESIAHLNQAEQEAVNALDRALEKVEAFVRTPPVKEETAEEPPVEKPKVTVKPRCIVKPAELVATTYLETTDDVEKFLGELRERLVAAIRAGQRIQIR